MTRAAATGVAVALCDVSIAFHLAAGGSYRAVRHASLDVADGDLSRSSGRPVAARPRCSTSPPVCFRRLPAVSIFSV
jgi:hypothetical protein